MSKSLLVGTGDLVSLEGRRAVVTGAGAGIGRAIALRLADAGADLHLVDIDEDGLAETEGLVTEAFPARSAATHKVDLASKDEIDGFWEVLLQPGEAEGTRVGDGVGDADAGLPERRMRRGRSRRPDLPDILVNNAGIFPMKNFLEVDEQFLQMTMDVNLSSALWMSQAFIRHREKQGGAIVNVSSIEAVLPFKSDMIPYTVSKAGVAALTRGMARDYGADGFQINGIVPGGIHTAGTGALIREAITRVRFDLIKTGMEFQSRLPLKRWGQPDEVARVVLFLVSDMASYVQGALIPVDGGFLST